MAHPGYAAWYVKPVPLVVLTDLSLVHLVQLIILAKSTRTLVGLPHSRNRGPGQILLPRRIRFLVATSRRGQHRRASKRSPADVHPPHDYLCPHVRKLLLPPN